MNYQNFFENLTSPVRRPHGWQSDLAFQEECTNRLIRIPTGFGKTPGYGTEYSDRMTAGHAVWCGVCRCGYWWNRPNRKHAVCLANLVCSGTGDPIIPQKSACIF